MPPKGTLCPPILGVSESTYQGLPLGILSVLETLQLGPDWAGEARAVGTLQKASTLALCLPVPMAVASDCTSQACELDFYVSSCQFLPSSLIPPPPLLLILL